MSEQRISKIFRNFVESYFTSISEYSGNQDRHYTGFETESPLEDASKEELITAFSQYITEHINNSLL